jgi:uncharacterized protein (TIGR03435 family)
LRRATLFIAPMLLFGQTTAPPKFEAASVKQNKSPEVRSDFRTAPNGVTITNYRLRFLIPYAFGVVVHQIDGAPSWVDSNKYDIFARASDGTSEDQLRLMVQRLLVDRFKLRFHRETKDLASYALTLANGGPRFTAEKKPSEVGKDDGHVGAGRGVATGHMVPSSTLAMTLGLYLGRPVFDKTGIDGVFNFELHWTPDEMQPPLGDATPPPAGTPAPERPAEPGQSFLSAVEEQLGLKLTGQRVPVEMIVIDHLEEVPTEN